MSRRPPDDLYDWVIVHRLWDGVPPGRNPSLAEIRELFTMAAEFGYNDKQLAIRSHKHRRQICRWRRDLRRRNLIP